MTYQRPELTPEQKRGVELMKQGAKLFFTGVAEKELFKHLVNGETVIGSYADSGGYIHSEMQPLCEYDTISVINVLRHGLLSAENTIIPQSTPVNYYTEKWGNRFPSFPGV